MFPDRVGGEPDGVEQIEDHVKAVVEVSVHQSPTREAAGTMEGNGPIPHGQGRPRLRGKCRRAATHRRVPPQRPEQNSDDVVVTAPSRHGSRGRGQTWPCSGSRSADRSRRRGDSSDGITDENSTEMGPGWLGMSQQTIRCPRSTIHQPSGRPPKSVWPALPWTSRQLVTAEGIRHGRR